MCNMSPYYCCAYCICKTATTMQAIRMSRPDEECFRDAVFLSLCNEWMGTAQSYLPSLGHLGVESTTADAGNA